MENKASEQQVLRLVNRSCFELNGVDSVSGFDKNYVSLDTSLGRIYIDGENLRILDLSQESGKILIEGMISCISFQDSNEKKKKSIFG